MATKLSWTPVHDLEKGTFCSPACGGRCKRADFFFAKREARKLCDALGHGWEPYVWENLGWHYSVFLPLAKRKRWSHKTPRIELHISGGGIFWASLEALGHQRTSGQVRGARRAINRLVNVLRQEVNEATHALSRVTAAL